MVLLVRVAVPPWRRLKADGVTGAAKVAEVSIVRTRLAIERSGHAKTVCHDGVVRLRTAGFWFRPHLKVAPLFP